jgi:hypothetical protein
MAPLIRTRNACSFSFLLALIILGNLSISTGIQHCGVGREYTVSPTRPRRQLLLRLPWFCSAYGGFGAGLSAGFARKAAEDARRVEEERKKTDAQKGKQKDDDLAYDT